MARARKTTPAKPDTEGAQAPAIPAAAVEQPGAGAGEVAAQAADLSGESAAPVAPQVNPRDLPEVFLTITGPKRGRRRAGRQFGPEPVQIAAADLSEAEIRALKADPTLKIDVSSVPG
ncbi:MAG: hypothetical protein K0B00_05335 [Rhodobacteraceae bacterium]|nr:hypothetical protein [Paracoccaceae bacterium]